jgi:hypothetical protein
LILKVVERRYFSNPPIGSAAARCDLRPASLLELARTLAELRHAAPERPVVGDDLNARTVDLGP